MLILPVTEPSPVWPPRLLSSPCRLVCFPVSCSSPACLPSRCRPLDCWPTDDFPAHLSVTLLFALCLRYPAPVVCPCTWVLPNHPITIYIYICIYMCVCVSSVERSGSYFQWQLNPSCYMKDICTIQWGSTPTYWFPKHCHYAPLKKHYH
jgi:hypothetical protein